jgi:hypothetical protein
MDGERVAVARGLLEFEFNLGRQLMILGRAEDGALCSIRHGCRTRST